MPIITLTTDFGLKDGNVGVMKGVIWKIAPQAQIADLGHLISPQNIAEAALILARSVPYFPEGTIHVVVVDPGVGTTRRPIAARIGNQFYVGPDNGTITHWLESAEAQITPVEFVQLTKPEYWLPSVSYVFHGRDVFAPCAAHLAAGVHLHQLGKLMEDPVRLTLPRPEQTSTGWRGHVIHVDHFGNISSNLRAEHLGDNFPTNMDAITVRVGGVEIRGMVNTFGERPAGELVALLGSTGSLIVSVVNGSAAQRLNSKLNDPVEVSLG